MALARQPWKSSCGHLSACHCGFTDWQAPEHHAFWPLGLCTCCFLSLKLYSSALHHLQACVQVLLPLRSLIWFQACSFLGTWSFLFCLPCPPWTVALPVSSLPEGRDLVLFGTQCGACHLGGTHTLEAVKKWTVVSTHRSHDYLPRIYSMLPLRHLLLL